MAVGLSNDKKRVAFGALDNTLRAGDIESGREAYPSLEGHESWVTFVAFSPDGKWIASTTSAEKQFEFGMQ